MTATDRQGNYFSGSQSPILFVSIVCHVSIQKRSQMKHPLKNLEGD